MIIPADVTNILNKSFDVYSIEDYVKENIELQKKWKEFKIDSEIWIK